MIPDDLTGSAFLSFPIEKHTFFGLGNDWLCTICDRPRALHFHDGFVPSPAKPKLCMDQSVRYGKHPHFYTPGSLAAVYPSLKI